MSVTWTDLSRYHTERIYHYDGKDRVTVTCKDVLYVSYHETLGKIQSSVDPDGGPFLSVGGIVRHGTYAFRILDILSDTLRHKTLSVLLRVERMES